MSLAHAMCLEVVLESVESADQLAGSQEMGGDLAQGYYFATTSRRLSQAKELVSYLVIHFLPDGKVCPRPDHA